MLRFMMVRFLITSASITRTDGSEGKTQHGSGGGLPRGRSGHSTQGRLICHPFGRSGHSTQGRFICYLFGRSEHSAQGRLICHPLIELKTVPKVG